MAVKTGSELSGMAVMTLAGGTRLGRLQDTVFQVGTGRVVGFLVDTGGLLSKAKFLPLAAVNSVGSDALTVADESVFADTPATGGDILEARPLSGRTIMNEAGTALGTVKDILVDTDTLLVPALVIATGFLDNALHGRPSLPLSLVQTVGKDSIVVANSYDPKASANAA